MHQRLFVSAPGCFWSSGLDFHFSGALTVLMASADVSAFARLPAKGALSTSADRAAKKRKCGERLDERLGERLQALSQMQGNPALGIQKQEASVVDTIVPTELGVQHQEDVLGEQASGSEARRDSLRQRRRWRSDQIVVEVDIVKALSQRCERAEGLNSAWAIHFVFNYC